MHMILTLCGCFLPEMGMDTKTVETTAPTFPTALSLTQITMVLETTVMMMMTMMVYLTLKLWEVMALITAGLFPIPTRKTQMVINIFHGYLHYCYEHDCHSLKFQTACFLCTWYS